MSTVIDGPVVLDDDASGNTGTPWEQAYADDLYASINAMFNGASTFELGGALALGRYTTTATGTQNNWDIDAANGNVSVGVLRCNNASALTINGILASSGHRLLLVVAKNSTVNLAHEAGGSTAANRLITASAATVALAAGGWAMLMYDVTSARWMVLAVGGGVAISGTPANNQVGVWTGATDLEGASGLQFDGAKLYVGDAANDFQTQGLTINQGASDNEILSLKSSDVAHGMTAVTEPDTFGRFAKFSPTNGGLDIVGLSGGDQALTFTAAVTTDTSGKATTADGAITFDARKKSGTGTAALAGNANIAVFRTFGTTRFILDADGDSHQDVGTAWTNFDSHDDVLALNALALEVSRDDDPYKAAIRQHFGDALEAMIPRAELERMQLVKFNPDGHHFVNMSKLAMLHTGAIRQLARAHDRVTKALLAAGIVTPAQLEAAE